MCTVIDDGTIRNRRGSLNVDDEGNPTQRNVLIENGILRGYLQDQLSSRILGETPTGNGRRESYEHIPMPRMTNTFMLAGESDPADIIRSVPKGIYCANFGGGQVDITSGNFVFSASESYLIEDGKLTRPVRNATLIGNGPEALKLRQHGGQRSAAGRRHRHLRQRRTKRAGGRRHSHDQDRPHDRGRHGVSQNHLAELAAETVKQALARGATDAECTISEGSEFSANVRMREVESLKEAGSRGAGLRILIGKHTGSAYTSDLSAEGMSRMVASALELASITTEDPHAGLPDAAELGATLRRPAALLRGSRESRNAGEDRDGARRRSRCARRRPAHHQFRRSFVRFAPGAARVRQLARICGRVPVELLLALGGSGGA